MGASLLTHEINNFRQRVLAPLNADRFLQQHWEREPLHIGRNDPAHFSSLLNLPQIEQLLSTQNLSFPAVQLTRSDQDIAPQDYCDDNQRIAPLRALAHYAQGATLIISHAQNLLAGLSQLCTDTEAVLQMPSQANVYLSPAGQQGFNPHYDTHDVFILQVSGSKTFNFYSGGAELPFTHQKHDPEQSGSGTKNSEIRLEPGDCLYIPRGFVHDAQAHDDAPSLHITLGVFPVTVSELLQQTLQVASDQHPALRRAIDRNVWLGANAGETYGQQLRTLLEELNVFSDDNTNEALSRLRDDVALTAKPDCTGLLSTKVETINAHSAITAATTFRLTRRGNTVELAAQGQILEFAEPLASVVEQLPAHGHIALQSLRNVTDSQRVALAKQLLQNGIFKSDS